MDDKTKRILVEYANVNLALLSSIIELGKAQKNTLPEEFSQYLRDAVSALRKITEEMNNDG